MTGPGCVDCSKSKDRLNGCSCLKNYAVAARGDVKEGQPILFLPERLLLYVRMAVSIATSLSICHVRLNVTTVKALVAKIHRRHRYTTSEKQQRILANVDDDDALVLLLLKERALGSDSAWAPYLNMLPQRPALPMFFHDKALDALQARS